jgi:diguanylate cyclase (GGDEF)-like protein
MTTILIVDDRAINREFLTTLLSYAGYKVLQASDGAEALAVVLNQRPDLVITDVLMPIMDGVEFADRVHQAADIAHTPIIFYTATYRLPEAKILGQSCQAVAVLAKPAEPQEILNAIAAALGGLPATAMTPPAEPIRPGHLGSRLPTHIRDLIETAPPLEDAFQVVEQGDPKLKQRDYLCSGPRSLHALSLRLATLLEFDLALGSERDAQEMVELFCRASQDILNCKYAVVGILDNEGRRLQYSAARGLDEEAKQKFDSFHPMDGIFGSVITSGQSHLAYNKNGLSGALSIPTLLPGIHSLLVVSIPVRSATSVYGWLCLAEKVGHESFQEEDEQFAVTLAAQFALTFGNLTQYNEIQQHAAKLEIEVSERRRAQAELAHRLTHDQITGLPRFLLIEEYISTAIVEAAASSSHVAVLYVDIDRFHAINETRGRPAGDHVLREISVRLCAAIGDRGKVAHIAADEFVLVYLDHAGERIEFADLVRRHVEEQIRYLDQRIYVTSSIGVSCFPENGSDPHSLLRQAEAAMLRGKREDGRNTVSAFSNEQKQALEDRLVLGSRLNDAIRAGQLVVHYQPQISGSDWQIFGFEALVRWQSPEFGLLLPGRFIDVAEDLGLIVDVGNFVLETVCRQIRAWLDAGSENFLVSINVSAVQLQRPDFVNKIRATLNGWDLPGRYIELELTESMMAGSVERMIGTMHALRELGVRIALDDFGTGYSSLNHLRRFPIDTLKIDQSFVRDISSDPRAGGICRAIITLGHQLGMTVLAEGVETMAQIGYLRRNDCDEFQGYYFGRPAVAASAFEMLRRRYVGDDILTQQQDTQSLLLVDSEESTLHALGVALRRDGYRIRTAMSVDDAFDVLARNNVQVVLSAVRMPNCSGIDFLDKVKKMYPRTLLLILVGDADLALATEAIDCGAIYNSVVNPWNDDDLRFHISEAFRHYESHIVTPY